jgi:hypothetical protein
MGNESTRLGTAGHFANRPYDTAASWISIGMHNHASETHPRHCDQNSLHDALLNSRVTSDRMKDDEGNRSIGIQSHTRPPRLGYWTDIAKIIQSWCADHTYTIGGLPHSDQPPRRTRASGEMTMSKSGDRMPNRIIEMARRPVTAMNMSQNALSRRRRKSARQCLDPVAQHDHGIRIEPPKRPGESRYAGAQCLSDSATGFSLGLHWYTGSDLETIFADVSDRAPTTFKQVHPGRNDLQFQSGVVVQCAHHRPEQPIL